MSEPKKGFFARYKKLLLTLLVVYVVLLVVFGLFSGVEDAPFVYQVF